MRILVLYGVVFGLFAYAFRDWFRVVCALIAMTAIAEHPDMPRSLLGIPGLNVGNALLLVVLVAWVVSPRRDRPLRDAPASFVVLGAVYALVVVVASLRLLADQTNLPFSTIESANEFFFNTLKFVLPGLLLFDGCRSRERFAFAVLAILGFYFLLAVQIVKWVPPWYAFDAAELERRSREILAKETGFYRTDLSMMMAGAAWAFLSTRVLFPNRYIRLAFFGASVLSTLAVALTAGRAGYITWAIVGAVICVLRFRKALLLVPLAVVVVAWALPGAVGRLREGVSSGDGMVEEPVNKDALSAGRTNIWPYVIEGIDAAPFFGHGRQAMVRTGLTARSAQLSDVGETVPHPHNSYLELLLDCGWVGFVPVMVFYALLMGVALRLLVDTRSPIFVAAGGLGVSLIFAFLVSGIAGRHFYPDENTFGMWCAIGLVLRTWVERRRTLAQTGRGEGLARPVASSRPGPVRPRVVASAMAKA